jgi:phospholipid/cholesterol/gamma-HCH transport system permease protein
MSETDTPTTSAWPRRAIDRLGRPAVAGLSYVGGLALLIWESLLWVYRSVVLRRVRFGRFALYTQMVRLGARSIGVVVLVNGCIGLILALQMAPPLEEFGQTERVANIIGIAVFRELGPLISAVVLTGFAGASIAAELGTMVVGEEVEALEAHALNPVRFLVMPRVLATIVSMYCLTVLAELVAITAGWWIGVFFLDIPSGVYINNTIDQLKIVDFWTGRPLGDRRRRRRRAGDHQHRRPLDRDDHLQRPDLHLDLLPPRLDVIPPA